MKMTLRRSGAALATVAGLIAAAVVAAQPARAETVSIACGAVGKELELCKSLSDAWAKKTGNTVKIVSTPNSTTERLALYQQLLAAGSGDVDVFEIDTIWPGILGTHFIDLAPYTKGAEKDGFPAIIQNDTRDGKLIAMPIYTDAGLMYYRKDLLEKYGIKPPETWDDLAAAAKKVMDGEHAANAGMQGFVFQGKAYEGLTCDALEWVSSFGGGTIVDPSGKVTINNPQAIKALDTAATWLKSGIAPQGVLNYSEEESRGVFQSGNAVFMRNWPYAWPLAQGADSPIKDKVGVMQIPKGGDDGKHASALGGWQMAVSKYSKHPEIAADLVVYLTSKDAQKIWSIEGGYTPAIPALYKDPDVIKANPFFAQLYDTFVSAVPRPATVTGGKYNQVSNEFWNATYDVLAGKADAKTSLAALDAKLNRMGRGGKW